jgi:hypothetical protein
MSPTLYSQVGLGRILPIVFQTILNSIIGLKFIIDCLELGLGNEKAPQNFEVYAPKIASASNKYESAFHVVLWVILLGYYVFFALSENQMGGNGYGGFYQFSNLVRIILPAVMISVIFILLNKRAQQTLKRLVFFVQQLVFQNLKTILVTSALFFVGFFIFRNARIVCTFSYLVLRQHVVWLVSEIFLPVAVVYGWRGIRISFTFICEEI